MKNVQQWYKSKEMWKNYGYFRERRYYNQGKSIHCIITKGQLLKKIETQILKCMLLL